MSTKHVRNASDLARFKRGLKLECGGCGYSRTLDGIEFAKTYGIKSFLTIPTANEVLPLTAYSPGSY
jgi:hypothetical protein